MTYTVWVADLNSLYNEQPNAPVVEKTVETKEQATKLVAELQDHQTAAWYVENKDK